MVGSKGVSQPPLVLATRNKGKAEEFRRVLGRVFVLQTLPAAIEMPEETGATFAENARLKAEAVFAALGRTRPVLADDSGLEVTALGGEPGVRSARYAGEGSSDAENVAKLLRELDGVADRSARFVCNLCLIVPSGLAGQDGTGIGQPLIIEVSGVVEGTIEREARGSEGFGYDPVFRPLGWSETLGEAAAAQKDAVSHRGAAARALLDRLAAMGF
jgi:XTP/dITP diphosphohydrolase